jgi:hypothetical protein
MGSVEFALYCADNKASTVLLVALRRFNAKSGKDIARLDPRSLLLVFSKAFDGISVRAREYDAYLEQWMFDAALNGDPTTIRRTEIQPHGAEGRRSIRACGRG